MEGVAYQYQERPPVALQVRVMISDFFIYFLFVPSFISFLRFFSFFLKETKYNIAETVYHKTDGCSWYVRPARLTAISSAERSRRS